MIKSRFVQDFSLRAKVRGTSIEVVIIRASDNAVEEFYLTSELLKEMKRSRGEEVVEELKPQQPVADEAEDTAHQVAEEELAAEEDK